MFTSICFLVLWNWIFLLCNHMATFVLLWVPWQISDVWWWELSVEMWHLADILTNCSLMSSWWNVRALLITCKFSVGDHAANSDSRCKKFLLLGCSHLVMSVICKGVWQVGNHSIGRRWALLLLLLLWLLLPLLSGFLLQCHTDVMLVCDVMLIFDHKCNCGPFHNDCGWCLVFWLACRCGDIVSVGGSSLMTRQHLSGRRGHLAISNHPNGTRRDNGS